MKLSKKHGIILGVVVSVLIVAAAVGWRIILERQYMQAEQKGSVQSTENVADTPASEATDVSTGKTYRNEKYGFEFKLSDEYSVSENMKNQVKTEGNVMYLDPQKTEYTFNSRKGLKMLNEWGQRGDVTDSWVIRVNTFDYSKEFDDDFKGWIRRNHDVDVEKFGISESLLNKWESANFVSWASIGSDYSAFFTNRKSIVEIDTSGTSFFYDSNPDYFSAILGTFRYYQ